MYYSSLGPPAFPSPVFEELRRTDSLSRQFCQSMFRGPKLKAAHVSVRLLHFCDCLPENPLTTTSTVVAHPLLSREHLYHSLLRDTLALSGGPRCHRPALYRAGSGRIQDIYFQGEYGHCGEKVQACTSQTVLVAPEAQKAGKCLTSSKVVVRCPASSNAAQ